ncbi:L,D-transpeptidase, partial [Bacillus sp. SIMBA_069]
VRADSLHPAGKATHRVVISVARQTLTIEDLSGAVQQSFAVAVGAPGTPTPAGVTGYVEERYLDPQQGQSTYPIQLTSLHSSAQDE